MTPSASRHASPSAADRRFPGGQFRRGSGGGAGQTRCPLCGDARRHTDRPRRLGDRHRQRPIHGGGERDDDRPRAPVRERPGIERCARPGPERQSFSSTYASNIASDQKSEDLRIVLQNGAVKDVAIDPPTPVHPDRIRYGVAPSRGGRTMTAALIRVANGDPVSAETSESQHRSFRRRMRCDVKLSFKRFEAVSLPARL